MPFNDAKTKVCALLTSLTLTGALNADAVVGLLGGGVAKDNTNTSYNGLLYQVFDSGKIRMVPITPIQGDTFTVAINNSGLAITGGAFEPNFNAFATLLPPSSSAAPIPIFLPTPPPNGFVASVDINDSGNCILAGSGFDSMIFADLPLVYTLAPGQTTAQLITSPLFPTNSFFNTAAINASGESLIGGQDDAGPMIAYFIEPSGAVIQITGFPLGGQINSVDLNDSGTGILGGFTSTPYAAFVRSGPTPTATSVTLPGAVGNGVIASVAINNSGNAVIVGSLRPTGSPSTWTPLAYIVKEGETTATRLDPSLFPPQATMTSAAVNSSGTALIGGVNTALDQSPTPRILTPIAYLVSEDGTIVKSLDDPNNPKIFPENGVVNSVAINDFGVGLIGGSKPHDSPRTPIAYLVTPLPEGRLIPLSLSFNTPFDGSLNSVDILNFVPISNLNGNNLDFAKYINQNAIYDAYYFIPALFDGTLKQALESAVPTRNAFSVIAADNNLFMLNSSLSSHSRNSRAFRRQLSNQNSEMAAIQEINEMDADLLLASLKPIEACCAKPKNVDNSCTIEERPYQLWVDVLGGLAYQKEEHQTPAFNPRTGAAILAFDVKAGQHTYVGAGAAYAYTHIHEEHKAGHANINQESVFLYSLWDNDNLYFDTAVWAGWFQSRNVRKVHMTAFEFTSKAHIKGWQLAPHFEIGYDINRCKSSYEPFVMLDWISNWQSSYKESGNNPFNAGQKHHYSSFLRSEAGVRFYQTVEYETWNLVFEEKVAYANKKPFKVGTVNAFIIGAPGSFTVETFSTTQNLGVAEFQMMFEPHNPNRPYGTIDYQGEFGSQFQSHVVRLGINWNF